MKKFSAIGRCQHPRDLASTRAGAGHHGRLQVVSAGSGRAWLRRPGEGHRRHPEPGASAEGAVRTGHLHDLPERRAATVRGRRSRQGKAPGHPAVEHLQHPAGLPGLHLRQRLQQVRPHIPGVCPGGGAIPRASGRCREPEDPQRQRRDGAHRLDFEHQVRHGPGSGRPLQRLPGIRYQQPGGARIFIRPGQLRPWSGCWPHCPMATASNGPS